MSLRLKKRSEDKMMKNKTVKKTLMITFSLLIMMSSLTLIQSKATMVPSTTTPLYGAEDTDYTTPFYAEGVEIYPFRSEAAGVHAGFIGGSVTLPFDLTLSRYSSLIAFQMVVSNQHKWHNHAPRRFWDVADGVSLMLVFRGDPDVAIDRGREIRDIIGATYGFDLFLVYGTYDSGLGLTMLVYQGVPIEYYFNQYVADFPDYVSDEGLGEGITSGVLISAPIKAMSVSLFRGPVFREMIPREIVALFPSVGITPLFIPIVECAWIDPHGLQKTDTIIEMNLTRLMPGLSSVQAAPDSKASFVSMKLPYIVDVLEIDPPTDNMYSHIKGEFVWTLRVDASIFDIARVYDDIYVKYDLNITSLTHYPKVIGEMSLNPASSLMGGGDVIYDFYFENVGDEPAYDIQLQYGEFNKNESLGMELPLPNPDLTYDPNQIMYYDNDTGVFSDVDSMGLNVGTVEGWFFNTSDGDWMFNNQVLSTDQLDNVLDYVYVNETFIELNQMDFDLTEIDDETWTLSKNIPQLNPGENVTLSFAVENIPTGMVDVYEGVAINSTAFQIVVTGTVDWKEAIIALLQLAGSTLHIPEDQVTWTNWFPQPVIGSAFIYNDEPSGIGKEYMGITNGLVIQVYDDEAILVGKMSLDKDVYRFGEDVTFSLELENIGDAPATNIHYNFFHAFLTEDFNIPIIQEIPGSYGTIASIAPGAKETVEYTHPAETAVGLHPVFAIFNYTSDETIDPLHPAIFSSVDHPAVFSSMDFGMVLPPLNEEGTTEPIYPTPEVNTTTEILGYVPNETSVGDTITLRTTIENTGDEDTNIIYAQFLPRRLSYVEDTLVITVDGVPVDDYIVQYVPYQPNQELSNYNPFMPVVQISGDRINGDLVGIPLAVNETLVIQADFTITRGRGIDEVDWTTYSGDELVELYFPPAQIRYFSHYEMRETHQLNGDTETPQEADAAELSIASSTSGIPGAFTTNSGPIIGGEYATTNSWGSYSDSLSLVIQEFLGLGPNVIYYGLGIIAVTGVAVLIYFTANGKRKR
ncbi:MAG: hypothetical protein FK733_08925 [Asgard group archaeon]|nr:hypothetical protein [Asgard group archaeon]